MKIVCVFCLATAHTRIAYQPHASTEIYVIAQPAVFKDYIALLMSPETRVVLVYQDIAQLINVLQIAQGDITIVQRPNRNVATEQVLRFLALKYNATYKCVSGDITADNVQLLLETETGPIFDAGGTKADKMRVHQTVPRGWDTWHRIEMLAKALPPGPKLYEPELKELEQVYEAVLGGADAGKLMALGQSALQ